MAANRSRKSRVRLAVGAMLLLYFTTAPILANAQGDTSEIDRRRLRTYALVAGAGYAAGLITLNHVWYQDTERQSFTFFNDNAEWKQADKAGHFFTAFHLADISSRALKSGGVRPSKADAAGALAGFLLTVPIEILDGFSKGYGASVGDAVADAAGPLFFLGQKMAWNEVRIQPKFSFHRTSYPPLRPSLLGDDLLSEIVKDYNGQTYWLSFDVDRFAAFPRWLNIALGYGAHDMIYARDRQNRARGFDPYRQYYLAIDPDLTSIRTRSRWIKGLLYVANMIRLPAPAVEFSRRGTKFHAFYF